MKLQAVVFDLDGTLLDTLADIGSSGNQVLSELGLPTHKIEDYRRFVGDGVKVLVERIVPVESHSPELLERAVVRFAEVYHERWNIATQPYAGVRILLTELTQRGVPMAVLSNKPQPFTELCVQHLLSDWKFAFVYGQREGVPRKPDPTAAIDLAQRLGVPPRQCAYVGDSSVDMQTACGAGMYAIGVAWGFRSVTELKAHGAKAILHHPCDLLTLLDEPNAEQTVSNGGKSDTP